MLRAHGLIKKRPRSLLRRHHERAADSLCHPSGSSNHYQQTTPHGCLRKISAGGEAIKGMSYTLFPRLRSEKEALRAASWGIVVPLGRSGMDQFSEHYQDLIEGIYDCSDRIVLNAYFPMGQAPGGMLVWWRALYGGDEDRDTPHLMRMAGRFSRRVRAFAEAKGIPIVDCAPKVKKFEIAQADLCKHDGRPGVFLILVAKSRAPVWEVERTK